MRRKTTFSKDVFGEYIHKYYYNKSIADGYTLKLIREGIETSYRAHLDSSAFLYGCQSVKNQGNLLLKATIFKYF